MAVTLDMMEYANDAVAQAAYVASDPEVVETNFESGGDSVQPIGDLAGTDYWNAFKFTIGGQIICPAASIYLTTKGGSPVGDMTFRLETGVADKPSGTLAHANATGTIANASISENAWNRCSFTPFTLAAGTYWLIVYVPDQANDTYWKWWKDVNGAGIMAHSTDYGDNWSLTSPRGLYFRVYAIHLQCYSEDTIVQQGTYSLEAIGKATDSLNDTLTRTVDPTIDLSGIDEVYFRIRSSRTGAHIKIGIHDAGGVTTEKTYTVIQINTWELVTWDVSGVADGNKDAIDSIVITILNADADNTFYLDEFYGAEDMVLTLEEKLALLENLTGLDRAYPALEENLALLESLPVLDRGLTLTEILALLESETVHVNAVFTESLGLLESLPVLERALTVEESLALLEDVTDMLLDDDSFEARLSEQMVKAGIYFEYKDVDYTNYLKDVSIITRSGELTSGFGTAILSNIEQTWNLFLADRTEIGSIAQIGVDLNWRGFTNQKELFTGKVEDVAYAEAAAILKIRDKMVSTLQKRMGNGENPVEYLTPQNPADLTWSLLTTHGGLDDTASTANTDIDYISWSAYKTDCTTLKYSLQAKFTGHYITNALLLIADLTSSYIWIAENGKFKFKRPIPPFIPGSLPSYDRSNCLKIDTSVTKENLINSFRCRYGWDEDVNEWTGSYLEEDETSKTDFGTYPGVEEDKVVWHADEDSATEHAERIVDKNKQPLMRVAIKSTLKGIFLSLGDTILVTELLKNLNPIYARVEEIQNVDIAQGLVEFICRDISDEKIFAFILDDPELGLLDQQDNPLM